jgi:hypothetical protein
VTSVKIAGLAAAAAATAFCPNDESKSRDPCLFPLFDLSIILICMFSLSPQKYTNIYVFHAQTLILLLLLEFSRTFQKFVISTRYFCSTKCGGAITFANLVDLNFEQNFSTYGRSALIFTSRKVGFRHEAKPRLLIFNTGSNLNS